MNESSAQVPRDRGFRKLPAFFLFAALAIMLTYIHQISIDILRYDDQIQLHNQIVRHIAQSPYQYRILQPYLVSLVTRIPKLPLRQTFLWSYGVIRFISFFVTFIAVWYFSKRYVSAIAALAGSLIMAAVIPFTYFHYFFQPTSVVELAGFAIGFVLIERGRWDWLAFLIAVSTFNRETMIFLAGYYALFHLRDRSIPRLVRESAFLALAWAIPFFGLRLMWPARESAVTITQCIHYNITKESVPIEVGIMVAPFVILALINARSKPPELVRCLCLVPVWLVLCFLFSQMNEVRYFLPMLVPEIPLVIITIVPAYQKARK
jgi:hypothetical protein